MRMLPHKDAVAIANVMASAIQPLTAKTACLPWGASLGAEASKTNLSVLSGAEVSNNKP